MRLTEIPLVKIHDHQPSMKSIGIPLGKIRDHRTSVRSIEILAMPWVTELRPRYGRTVEVEHLKLDTLVQMWLSTCEAMSDRTVEAKLRPNS